MEINKCIRKAFFTVQRSIISAIIISFVYKFTEVLLLSWSEIILVIICAELVLLIASIFTKFTLSLVCKNEKFKKIIGEDSEDSEKEN